ncbi:MAG: GNAT family N-acetyltransferase [Bdellovibrionales bacterium]|jgi:hypothetical protein|nr:GNAT family N-acetyltransferase [Bdellovibrionales bacterium]MBT3525289.1 GNAT family N-acetyltransferase [Bdellovibrionales bacterium]MBT7668174.1 GNAT family N-acetyltransferase [Bdellovibrionales bacterium]MBT7767708.1 GNAT family N-acetyltransferase [Bdellovibrionales bacterium]
MSDEQLIPVDCKKRQMEFINLPWKIYADDSTWVPPLKIAVKELLSPKHPFWEEAYQKSWLLERDGEMVGRIMAVVNHVHNRTYDEKCGFFGFFEAADQLAALELLSCAESFLLAEGMESMRGPCNPSTNYEIGTLVKGHSDPPQIMMTYNPARYGEWIESFGTGKIMDLLAYHLPLNVPMSPLIVRIAQRAERSNSVSYRCAVKSNWDSEVDKMMEIYNSAWEKNWGFIPVSAKEFRHIANDLKSVVDPELVIFAMMDGQEVGFIVTLPDYHQVFAKIPNGKLLPFGIFKLLRAKKYINRVRVITMGIKQEYRATGLAPLLYQRAHQAVVKKGYKEVEMSWILEENLAMIKPLEMMGATPYKRYRLYEKRIG